MKLNQYALGYGWLATIFNIVFLLGIALIIYQYATGARKV